MQGSRRLEVLDAPATRGSGPAGNEGLRPPRRARDVNDGRGRRSAIHGVSRLLTAGLLAAGLAGCNGSASIQFVSLHPSEIEPPPATVWRLHAQECYWWLDEAGELNVAMSCKIRNPLLGKYGRADFDLSLVLGSPPAGSGRNYSIRQYETRTIFVSALQSVRWTSHNGIVGITVRDDGAIWGSFRVWLTPQTELQMMSFLPDRMGPALCFGTFRAVEDEARGKAVRSRCESGGWARPPRQGGATASQPVGPATTQPAALPVTSPASG